MAEENPNPSASAGPGSSEPEVPPVVETKGDEFLDVLAANKNEFNDEDIDQFLQIQDPEFSQQLGQMSGDRELSLADTEIDEDTAALHDEIERWRTSSGIKRSLYLVLPFLPRVSLAVKRLKFRLFASARSLKIRTQNFLYDLAVDGRKRVTQGLSHWWQSTREGLGHFFRSLKSMSLKLKLALGALVILFGGSIYLLFLTWKGALIPTPKQLFVTNLADYATETFEIDEEEGYENFYDNVRSAPNLLLIQKVIVNIKPSAGSGPNPMLAMDFFVEGLNPDVVIEVKDRESFFRDQLQRAIEETTFDEVSTTEGKQKLLLSLLKEMNRHLTTGELRNIRIKTFVIKP